MNRPTTPSERAAAEARRLAQLRATRAAEIGRRQAAAKRRLVLTVLLLTASVGGWLAFGLASVSIALGVVPTALLATVLVLGRRAAKIAARRNAADRALMARLDLRPGPRTHPAPGRAPQATAAAEPADADAPTAVESDASESATAAPAATTERAPLERSWTPVPVPVPAYTLRADAPRRDIAPYEAPQAEPVQAPAQTPAEPVVVAGLAGSPYAPVADPDVEDTPAPETLPARALDLDSVLARRRAVGA